jgi:TonB family protein
MEGSAARQAIGRRRIAPGEPRRMPLAARNRQKREAAQARIARLVRSPLTPSQQARDPLRHHRSRSQRSIRAAAVVLGTMAVHAGVLGIGWLNRAQPEHQKNAGRDLDIRIRERRPPPVPPVVAAPAIAPAKPLAEKPSRHVLPREALPPAPIPVPSNAKPPLRIVGLSLEATAESGDGPSFAVGNARDGETAVRAVSPNDVVPGGSSPLFPEPTRATNQVARRLPSAGVRYSAPRRHKPSTPSYPADLKSQGIEADVTVMVDLDVAGKVTKVQIVKEAPHPAFNEEARRAAQAEDYEPATRDGVPIPYSLSFTYHFRLEDR